MHRDHDHESDLSGRQADRKEWRRSGDQSHQFEAREHARQPGKSLKTYGIRSDEAARQIRELGLRR
jgi:hypothetical protein